MAKAKKSKARKAAKATGKKKKASRPARATAARGRKSSARKAARKAPARKAKSAKRPTKKTVARKSATGRATAKKASPRTSRRQTKGEGDYAASRKFLKDQSGFVERNQDRIGAMGREAGEAMEGSEGASLRAAENEARSRSHAEGE